MSLTLVTRPAEEPLYLDEVKDHLKVEGSDQDAYLHGLIAAARRHIENKIERQLITATYDYALDCFPTNAIHLPLPPVQSIVSVSYIDENGAEQQLSDSAYRFVRGGIWHPRIVPVYGTNWPASRDQDEAVTVRFIAGFGNANAVEDPIKWAMKLIIGHWFANREEVATGVTVSRIPEAAEALLARYRKYT